MTDDTERYVVIEYRGRWWVKDIITRQMSSPRAMREEVEVRLRNLLQYGSVMGKLSKLPNGELTQKGIAKCLVPDAKNLYV